MLILSKSPMELKYILGKRIAENGTLVRMNKIALEQIKFILSDKQFEGWRKAWLYEYFGGDYENERLAYNACAKHFYRGDIRLDGIGLYMDVEGYATDCLHGICEDGDINCIRLVKYTDDGGEKIIKKKIGKVVADALRNVTTLCPQAKTFIQEDIARRWKAYATEHAPNASKYTLVVNDDFASIYNRGKQIGDFHSCMNGCDGIEFYERVDAKAASLRDEDGMIVARCVVFTKVHCENGNTYRYAERQYSTNQDWALQQLLVNKLYSEGYIDLNKRVGASCHDSDDVVDRDGNAFEDELWIDVELESGDYCPYMDGFAYYHYDEYKASNKNRGYCDELHNTSGYYGESRVCDVCGRRMSEDDACWSEYHHMELCEDCAVWSEHMDTYLRRDSAVGVYSAGGYFDDWMPDDWDGSHSEYVDVNGRFYWLEDCVYDDLNDEYIFWDDSISFKRRYSWGWSEERTSENEIDFSVVEYDDEYWFVDDCECVDGVWYPFDRVPEQELEEVIGLA